MIICSELAVSRAEEATGSMMQHSLGIPELFLNNKRSVSPINESSDEDSPEIFRKSPAGLTSLGPLPDSRHSYMVLTRTSSSSTTTSSEPPTTPRGVASEQDISVFSPNLNITKLHVEASPRVLARHYQHKQTQPKRKVAVVQPPLHDLDNVEGSTDTLLESFELPPRKPPERIPILPARYREVLYNRKLRLIEQRSVKEDRKPLPMSDIRRRAISEVAKPDLRRLPPTHGDILDAVKWLRYQLNELRKQDAAVKDDLDYVQQWVNEVNTPEAADQSPLLKPCHIRFASEPADLSMTLESPSPTMGLANLRGGLGLANSYGSGTRDLEFSKALMKQDDYLGEFRERTLSLSREKPPSIIQKLLNQTSRTEEFV